MPPLPCPFGRYRLVEEIARGAHGIVYRALDLELDERVVALKVLRVEDATRTAAERFWREARVAARLRHPDIIDIYDAGEEDGRPFFAMPLIEGGSLAEAVYAGDLDARAAARLLARIARAVDYAHRRGVVHRDLKPANVLLRADGTPVVTDFGIARDPMTLSLTKTGELIGTPSYMAPEQISGRVRQIDARTDVYALGAMLYEMLARRPPFTAPAFADLVTHVLNDPPVPPSHVDPLVDRDLERIALRCLRKDPRERYATAAELADDLERAARGEPVRVRPETTRAVVTRIARRHCLMLVAIVAAALGAGVALTAGAFARPPEAAPPARGLIVTEPEGASVYIDGRFAGVTPKDARPGEDVSLRLAGYAESRVVAAATGNRVRLLRPGEIPEGMVYDAEADLLVDRFEVTVAEYARFVEATGHRAPPTWKRSAMPRGEGDRPVTGVSWEDAAAFAAWARKRLPEAGEWRALAASSAGPMTCAPLDEAQPAGSAAGDRSRAGACDMLGNVREWTATRGSAADDFRIVCGGSWERPSKECTADASEERRIDTRSRDLGFRCVVNPPWKR